MFWFVVPETYSFGSLTILLARCFVAVTEHRQLSSLWCSWENALQNPKEADDDRTAISALWPTWVGTHKKDEIAKHLETRWQKRRDASGNFRSPPLWTYFDIAEAHQWLLLNQPDRLWTTLQWFWENQASPGLYTWWEGNGEENTFKRWEQVRGWVAPPHVTPHYWTTAEMLLMQLDMLAYIDVSDDNPIVVLVQVFLRSG